MLYELRFIEALHGFISSPFADRLAVAVSFLGNGGMVWILAIVVLLLSPKTRKAGIAAAVALAAEAVICSCLKIVIARPRPFDIDRSIELLIAPPSDYSFPSGHTASSFACASAIRYAGLRYSVPAFILASMIAFSRIYLLVHYPSDILGGVILGFACGQLGRWISGLLDKHIG